MSGLAERGIVEEVVEAADPRNPGGGESDRTT